MRNTDTTVGTVIDITMDTAMDTTMAVTAMVHIVELRLHACVS